MHYDRLRRDNLCKEIDPKRSSFKIRKNKVVITLIKKDKNDSWSNLTSKSTKLASKQQMDDPGASIMNLMKVRHLNVLTILTILVDGSQYVVQDTKRVLSAAERLPSRYLFLFPVQQNP